jgi:hypothetical protein
MMKRMEKREGERKRDILIEEKGKKKKTKEKR